MLNYLFTQTPFAFLTQSLWRDEAFSYLMAKKGIFEILALVAKDFSPPFYYIVLHFWMMLFGSSEIALRSLSLIFYWGTIYISYLYLVDVLKINSKKSIIYLILFLCNPILVWYAYEVRMYTMFAFFAVLSHYAFSRKNLKLYIISTTLGFYTHYFMLFVVLSQVLYVFIIKEHRKSLVSHLKGIALPFILYLPWFVYMLSQKPIFGESFWIDKVKLRDILYVPGILFSNFDRNFNAYQLNKSLYDQLLFLLSLVLIGIALFGLIKFKRTKNHDHLIYLLCWIFVPALVVFFVSFFKSTFLPRYLIFVAVGLLVMIVYVTDQIKLIPRIILLAVIIGLSVYFQHLQLKYQMKTNMAKTFKEIKALAGKNDVVYVDLLDFHTAEYYVDEKRVYIWGKTYEEIPNYVGKVLMPKDKVATNLPVYPNKAFVVDNSGNYTIQGQF